MKNTADERYPNGYLILCVEPACVNAAHNGTEMQHIAQSDYVSPSRARRSLTTSLATEREKPLDTRKRTSFG